jgi:hypothetical protein
LSAVVAAAGASRQIEAGLARAQALLGQLADEDRVVELDRAITRHGDGAVLGQPADRQLPDRVIGTIERGALGDQLTGQARSATSTRLTRSCPGGGRCPDAQDAANGRSATAFWSAPPPRRAIGQDAPVGDRIARGQLAAGGPARGSPGGWCCPACGAEQAEDLWPIMNRVAGRLVDREQRGLGDQGARDGDPLPLPAR